MSDRSGGSTTRRCEVAYMALAKMEFKRIRRIACVFLILVGLGIFSWSIIAPIQSAVFAPGFVRTEYYSQKIQHLDGGTIDRIWVKEGDFVSQGTVLITLDSSEVESQLRAEATALAHNLVIKARLLAAQQGEFRLQLDQRTQQLAQHWDLFPLVEQQQRLLTLEHRNREDQRYKVFSETEQLSARQTALIELIRNKQRLIAIVDSEWAAVARMITKKLASESQLNPLRKQHAVITGELYEYRAELEQVNKTLSEQETEVLRLNTMFKIQSIRALQEIETQMPALNREVERLAAMLTRVQVRARVSGRVNNLQVTNSGTSIIAGAHLLDILPDRERLVIEAHLKPDDVREVHPGKSAQVMLKSYNVRHVPTMDAKVIQISPDRLMDSSGEYYFRVILSVSGSAQNKASGMSLYSGMSAEVFINTGSRTLIDYLLTPVFSAIKKSLREG